MHMDYLSILVGFSVADPGSYVPNAGYFIVSGDRLS